MTKEKMNGLHWCQNKIKDSGYKLTMPREIILDVLKKTSDHLSAEEIYQTVYQVYPDIGLATVYRTLELLVRIGLLLKFDFGDGRARYELKEGPKSDIPHHHLVCTYCSRVIDYSDSVNEFIDLRRKIEKELSKKYQFKILNHFFRFDGICDKCQRGEAGKANGHKMKQKEPESEENQ